MNSEPWIKLSRDVEGVQIPDGNHVKLEAGTEVRVTQSLGGSFTIITGWGSLVRLENQYANAIGKEPQSTSQPVSKATSVEDQVWEQLRTCYDPEIPVNIVDLGLVYVCVAKPTPENGYEVDVHFTLTAPGCGMGGILKTDIEMKLSAIPRVQKVNVEVVFEPPWDRSMMSEAAKLQLGML